jgi:hypothetical protein
MPLGIGRCPVQGRMREGSKDRYLEPKGEPADWRIRPLVIGTRQTVEKTTFIRLSDKTIAYNLAIWQGPRSTLAILPHLAVISFNFKLPP